jgi:hypothetical protein
MNTYCGLQFCVSCVETILVIAHTSRAKTSFAPTEKRSHANENRCKTVVKKDFSNNLLLVFLRVHPAMLPMIPQVRFVQAMTKIDRQPTFAAEQGEIIGYGNTAQLEENVVVGTEAQQILRRIRTVMRRGQRANVGGFSVRPNWRAKAGPTDLTTIMIQFLELPPSLGFTDGTNNAQLRA